MRRRLRNFCKNIKAAIVLFSASASFKYDLFLETEALNSTLLRATATSLLALATLAASTFAVAQTPPADPYLWLEDVTGEKALNFVKQQNAITLKELQSKPQFAPLEDKVLAILNDQAQIPFATKLGAYLYNFWRDAANPRGVWRRTTMTEYSKPHPAWEVILDVDALAKAENENWVFKGQNCLRPKYERCLISLSRGGADAAVVREFDVSSRSFVKEGFVVPEAKSSIDWRDENTVYIGTDFGPGSLTDSGYPRISKRWSRGTPLSAAVPVFEGSKTDVWAGAWVDDTPGFFREGFIRAPQQRESEMFILIEGKSVKIPKPLDASFNTWREYATITLRSDWSVGGKTFKQGSLLVIKLDAFLGGERNFEVLFEPTERTSLAGVSETRSSLVINTNDNIISRSFELRPSPGGWKRRELKLPGLGTGSATAVSYDSDELWVTYTDFLTPTSLYLTRVGEDVKAPLKSQPSYWNSGDAMVEQLEATSKDGTRVPYFVVRSKNTKRDGNNPTLLYGYGGFEISQKPSYSGSIGSAWIAKGGVYVLANIRGGGEFGPRWHQAALKGNRQRAFDDFIAIAEDLIARKITSPQHLAMQGGSNGGLLVATVLTQRPELFKAVVCQVPLTDMLRFHKLLAGASWMGEYGDPDVPEEHAFLEAYSPYQNLKKGMHYPRTLFMTSTRDDRVHPGHARKMFAKMKEQGSDVLYFENTEGGHAGAANNAQRAKMTALGYTFLLNALK